MKQYCYITNISKYPFYDIFVTNLLLFVDDQGHALELTTADSKDWGTPSTLVVVTSERFPLPIRLTMRWNAKSENKYFEIDEPLDQAKAEKLWEEHLQAFPDDPFAQYIIGIAPYGGVAIWLCNKHRSVLVQWLQALEIRPVEDEDVKTTTEPTPFNESVFPPSRLQSNMRQHRYRFVPLEEYFDGRQWQKYTNTSDIYEEIALDGVEVKRLDGTFDYADNVDLMRYHEAGKPQRIMVRWQEGKDSFFAHFWLDEAVVTSVFDSFFDAYPDASADLLLRIDTMANRYEIVLSSDGMPVQVLGNTQFIVAKNYFEICRSDNYSKKDGEWRWQ